MPGPVEPPATGPPGEPLSYPSAKIAIASQPADAQRQLSIPVKNQRSDLPTHASGGAP